MEYFKLNDGYLIPAIGIGTDTFGKLGRVFTNAADQDFEEVVLALENGYRYFDCAVYYGNEDGIGRVFEESKIDRSEIFLSSKIPTKYFENITISDVEKYVDSSLRKLRTSYIDLYLIHHYVDDKEQMKNVYQGLINMKNKGKIRSIGVSSFNEEQLNWIMSEFDVKPTVNQMRLNPGVHYLDQVNYCVSNDILPIAYSVLRDVNDVCRILLNSIGSKYNKTWHQILLRFNYQLGVCSIPKSHVKKHQLNNISIFDFSLSDSEMDLIKKTVYIAKKV